MFFDTAHIRGNTLVTHRSIFLLDRITAADVQSPFVSMALIPTLGAAAFTLGFIDILYLGEVFIILGGAATWLMIGANIGQLKLVSSDLRGSEVSGAVWGSYRHLCNIHAEINSVWDQQEVSNASDK